MSQLCHITVSTRTWPLFAGSKFRSFKIGVLLKKAREEAGLTQDELAKQLNTKKTAISRIENHVEDIRLSTLEKYAQTFGKKLKVELVE